MTPFDFINAINSTKKDLLAEDPMAKKDYVPFIINRGLGYFPDTVLYANEMNRNSSIPVDWQFSFLLNSISKKKRFSNFGYSDSKAVDALSILTEDHLVMIKEKLYKGGK
jgi:hypothetical protein